MNEESYSKITIQNLRMQNINRSTFYLHYKSKDDFLNSIIEETLNEMIEYVKSNPMNEDAIFNIDFEISFYRLLEFIELNFEFIKVHMNMNNTYFRALLVQKVREKSIILYWRRTR